MPFRSAYTSIPLNGDAQKSQLLCHPSLPFLWFLRGGKRKSLQLTWTIGASLYSQVHDDPIVKRIGLRDVRRSHLSKLNKHQVLTSARTNLLLSLSFEGKRKMLAGTRAKCAVRGKHLYSSVLFFLEENSIENCLRELLSNPGRALLCSDHTTTS